MPFRLLAKTLPLAALLAAGCGEPDDIRTYKVPKPAPAAKAPDAGPTAPDAKGGEYRIVGAMFPADDPQWFFKLQGRAEQIEPHAEAFQKMLATVRFPNGLRNAPVWDMPAGWKSGGPNPQRMAADTIRLGPADAPLEVTVTQVGGKPFANVERWAGQVGLAPFAEADLPKYTKPFDAQGVKGLWADVRGPKNPAGGRGGPFMGGR